MGKPQGRKKNRAKDKTHRRIVKTKSYTKHNDQIYEDLKPENIVKVTSQPTDEDLPGLGQFYCVHCAKHYVNMKGLDDHKRTKDHKRQVKVLRNKPYDLKEAEFLNKY